MDDDPLYLWCMNLLEAREVPPELTDTTDYTNEEEQP